MRQRSLITPRRVGPTGYPTLLMQKVLEISKRSQKDADALEQIVDLVLARLNRPVVKRPA